MLTFSAASFILNVIATQTDRTFAFYMPFTRFWELSCGGLLAYYVVQCSAKGHRALINYSLIDHKALPVIGFLLIALATALLDHKSAFPGFWALLPVIGTCMMIMPNHHAPRALGFLRSKPALLIGRISFSLYLWHWPILLLSQSADLKSRSAKFIALAACFVLAWLTYRFIEQPFRTIRVTRANAKKFIWLGALVTLVIALMGTLIATRTIKRSWDETLISKAYEVPIIGCGVFADLGREFNPALFERCDHIQFPANGTVMMLGDSHAYSLYQGLKPYLNAQEINLIAYPILECTPLSLNDKRPRCVDYNNWIESQIQKVKPQLVILFAHHLFRTKDPYYGEALPYPDYLWKAATKLKSEGIKNVWIIGDIPNWQESLPHAMNFNFLRHDKPVPERTYVYVVGDSLAMDTTLRAADNHQGVEFISLKDALCNEQGCLTHIGPDFPNDLLVMDYGHLTKNGAGYVSEKILGERILSLVRDHDAEKPPNKH